MGNFANFREMTISFDAKKVQNFAKQYGETKETLSQSFVKQNFAGKGFEIQSMKKI